MKDEGTDDTSNTTTPGKSMKKFGKRVFHFIEILHTLHFILGGIGWIIAMFSK